MTYGKIQFGVVEENTKVGNELILRTIKQGQTIHVAQGARTARPPPHARAPITCTACAKMSHVRLLRTRPARRHPPKGHFWAPAGMHLCVAARIPAIELPSV